MSLITKLASGQEKAVEHPLIPDIPMPSKYLANWSRLLEISLTCLDFSALLLSPRAAQSMFLCGLAAIRPLLKQAVFGSDPFRRAWCVVVLESLLASLPEEDRAYLPKNLDLQAVKALVAKDLEPWFSKRPDFWKAGARETGPAGQEPSGSSRAAGSRSGSRLKKR